jgi:5'-nucleotidase
MLDPEQIALFDMDGTLCDYDSALFKSLEELRSPEEKKVFYSHSKKLPKYLKKRADLIKRNEFWWENIPRFKLGWDILRVAQKKGFKIMILTQGPKKNPSSWSGKLKWLLKNIPETDITITRDKGLVYGKILVDDYPEYIKRWLSHRPRGLVIMPVNDSNKNFKHKNVLHYDGTNLKEIKKALDIVKKRKIRESLNLE